MQRSGRRTRWSSLQSRDQCLGKSGTSKQIGKLQGRRRCPRRRSRNGRSAGCLCVILKLFRRVWCRRRRGRVFRGLRRLSGFTRIDLSNHLEPRATEESRESLAGKLSYGQDLGVFAELRPNRLNRLIRRPHDELVDRIGRGTIFSNGSSGRGHSAPPDAIFMPISKTKAYHHINTVLMRFNLGLIA